MHLQLLIVDCATCSLWSMLVQTLKSNLDIYNRLVQSLDVQCAYSFRFVAVLGLFEWFLSNAIEIGVTLFTLLLYIFIIKWIRSPCIRNLCLLYGIANETCTVHTELMGIFVSIWITGTNVEQKFEHGNKIQLASDYDHSKKSFKFKINRNQNLIYSKVKPNCSVVAYLRSLQMKFGSHKTIVS